MPAQSLPATGSRTVRTNPVAGSTLNLKIWPVSFQQLWDNYVTGRPYSDPERTHSNQCAIRLSATLHRIGIDMKSFSQQNVRPGRGKSTLGRILLNGKPTATRADEMAQWLCLKPFAGLPQKPDVVTGPDWQDKVRGRTGIIFFGEYRQRDEDSPDAATGGHIDLWNGATLTANGITGAFHNFLRFRLGISSIPKLYHDLSRARTIWFFEIS
ncbi:type VI secretion system amidase effector protein Tae4 [Cupriavidus sp. WKF15]|uniref:type VI secretion system amidase effector protein Tae4 n=1 Tax=Cupriavidus sp. WKF15 TaxID=3032282 RepID=UPI0023E31189|nr:type VI secretion system amidase effector protein Tae4 [Cupriavidus sp. WKF15]WER46548.1 type VI secretion system amidase effector protein Tae4 [Cupriavidus sp. WKF15]